MPALSESVVSSSARPLKIRRRPDLIAQRQRYLDRTYWVVKDPLGLHYFRFQEEEFALLEMLDGQTSLDELKRRFEARFIPQKITLEELQHFLGMLHRNGLVTVDVPGQGEQLLVRRSQRRRQQWVGTLANILWLRFKGFDPERLLGWLYPKVRWCFSPLAVACSLALVLAAAMLIAVNFETFRARLPAFHEFFNLRNALWLAATLAGTKVLHELGHGLACRHFGGECHEIGVMLLVFTPCLYCNVSDSWMLPNKWHRALIGAAGMYVELVLAAICTFMWWFTEPGLLHYTCLNVMFICSVSTVIFNGNPLLRYDGYYILADLVEIPNLRQKSSALLGRKLGEWLLGIEMPDDPFLPQRRQLFFAAYVVAAAVYRWVVLASILWFIYQFFRPYGLQIIGNLLALVSLVGLVGMPLYQVAKFFYIPGRLEKVKKPRLYASLAALAVIALAVLFVPLPYSILCSLELQPREAARIWIDLPDGGKLAEVYVRPGQTVVAGEKLARLVNFDVELELAKLTDAVNQYRGKLAVLREQAPREPRALLEIPEIEAALRNVEEQLAARKADHQRLVLRAPRAGTVLPPPETTPQPTAEGCLPTWSGTPLDPWNLGSYLEEGVLFCQVGDPRRFEAILVIEQSDVEFVHGMLARGRPPRVDIKLDELPHRTFTSQVVEVANVELKITPRRLTAKAGGELATKTDPHTGLEKPHETSYYARAPLDDPEGLFRQGLRGTGRVYVGAMPLGKRLWRLFAHTFNFKL